MLDQANGERNMARRRSEENGLKRQQRLESERRDGQSPKGYTEPDDRHPEPTKPGAVPPGVTQLVENAAPPFTAPRPED
jgi:hypothetical protein